LGTVQATKSGPARAPPQAQVIKQRLARWHRMGHRRYLISRYRPLLFLLAVALLWLALAPEMVSAMVWGALDWILVRVRAMNWPLW